MEITVGIQNLAREVTVETDLNPEQARSEIDAALAAGTPLVLSDARGRQVVIPTAGIAYIEIGAESPRRIGFGG